MTRAEETPEANLDARLALSLLRVPRRLPDEEQQLVRQRIMRFLDLRQALRAVPLENGDEPAFTFDPAAVDRRQLKEEWT